MSPFDITFLKQHRGHSAISRSAQHSPWHQETIGGVSWIRGRGVQRTTDPLPPKHLSVCTSRLQVRRIGRVRYRCVGDNALTE